MGKNNEQDQDTEKPKPLAIFFGGLIGGICLSVVIIAGLFYFYSNQTIKFKSIQKIESTKTLLVFTPTIVPTQIDLLNLAELALNTGQPEKVRDLIYPAIENWNSNEDRIHGYKLLGQAELAQGHPQLAAPYFEKLYFYEPTAENLFLLATVYDSGGDTNNALAKYKELVSWEGLHQDSINIEFINLRIYDLSRALGTPVPTHTATP